MSYKNLRRNSLICTSSTLISSDKNKSDKSDSSQGENANMFNESLRWSDNLTDSDSLKLVLTDSASLCSDELKNAVTQTQEEDNLSSANTVIMDPEEGPEDHELELADTQVLTDYNDNSKIVIEPPKSPSQRHLPWSRKLSQSQLTKVSTKVIVEHSDSIVSQKMESCFLSCCDDKDVPLRSPLKKSPSHKRKLVQSSQVVSDSLSSEGLTKETKDDSPDLLYPTPPDQTNKRKRKTSEGVSQDCCPLCGKKMSFKALLKHTPDCYGGIKTRAASSALKSWRQARNVS